MYGFHTTRIASLVAAEAATRGETAQGAGEVLSQRPHRFWADQDALRTGNDLAKVVAVLDGIPGTELAAIAEDRQVPWPARTIAAVAALADPTVDADTKASLTGSLNPLPEAMFNDNIADWLVARLTLAPRWVRLQLVAAVDARLDESFGHVYGPHIARFERPVVAALGALSADEVAFIGHRPGTVWHLKQAGARIDGGWMGLAPTLPSSMRAGCVFAGLIAGEALDERLARRVFARMSERNARRMLLDPMRRDFVDGAVFDTPTVAPEALAPMAASGHLAVRLVAVALGHVPDDVDAFIAEAIAETHNPRATSEWRDGWVAKLVAKLPLTAAQATRAMSAWPFEAYAVAARHDVDAALVASCMVSAPVPAVASWLAGSLASSAPTPEQMAELIDTHSGTWADKVAAAVAHRWGPPVEWAVELLAARPSLARLYATHAAPTTSAALYEVFRNASAAELAAI